MDNRLQLHGILSAKFIALILHTLQMCVSVYAVENNIFSGLPMNYILDSNTAIAERDKITPMLIVMLAIGIIMNGIEFLFSLVNFTMLNHRLNIVNIVLHSLGLILQFWYTLDKWNYKTQWTIYVFFNILPFIVEMVSNFIGIRTFSKIK